MTARWIGVEKWIRPFSSLNQHRHMIATVTIRPIDSLLPSLLSAFAPASALAVGLCLLLLPLAAAVVCTLVTLGLCGSRTASPGFSPEGTETNLRTH